MRKVELLPTYLGLWGWLQPCALPQVLEAWWLITDQNNILEFTVNWKCGIKFWNQNYRQMQDTLSLRNTYIYSLQSMSIPVMMLWIYGYSVKSTYCSFITISCKFQAVSFPVFHPIFDHFPFPILHTDCVKGYKFRSKVGTQIFGPTNLCQPIRNAGTLSPQQTDCTAHQLSIILWRRL